jgi:hypothetical protein
MNSNSEVNQPARSRQEQIVLICDRHLSPRLCKIAWALKDSGFHTILLQHREAQRYLLETSGFFDETHLFDSPEHALALAYNFKPLVYHIFSSWNYDLAELFIKTRPGKIVFDDFDVISGVIRDDFVARNYPGMTERERYCLEHADGIVARSIELQHVKKKLNFNLRGKKLLFLDYCWNHPLPEPTRQDHELHLVYAGSVYVERFYPPGTSNDAFFYDFAVDLTAAGIHFHLYPSPAQTGDFRNYYSDFFDLAAVNPYFHIHFPVETHLLGAELAHYDIALVTAEKEQIDRGNEAYTPVKSRLCMPHKVFDYLDAGLGVIVAEGFAFPWRILKRKGAGACAYTSDVKAKILSAPPGTWTEMKRRARQTKKDYAIKAQIHRLIDFYFSLHEAAPRVKAPQPQAGDHLGLAHDLFRDGDFSGSLQATKLELQFYPGNLEALHFARTLKIAALKA